MIRLIPNADKKIQGMAYSKGVRACYNSVCERYAKGYEQMFISDIQMLILKLGAMINEVSTTPRQINYTATSIHYLCDTVLDKPHLEDTFDELEINNKGNKAKHSIETNSIDMDRCVTTYNNLVNLIASTYHLPSLAKAMVVSKKISNSAPAAPTRTPVPQPVSQQKPKKSSHPNEFSTNADGNLKLCAELQNTKKDRYQKGLFRKTSMVNFLIKVTIGNPDNLKIVSVTAYFKCGTNLVEKKLSTNNVSATEIDLETEKFSGNIEASVIVVYKIGLFKSKQIKATVSKNF